MSGGRTVTRDGDVATPEGEFLHINGIKAVGGIGAVFAKVSVTLIASDWNCNRDIGYRNWCDSAKGDESEVRIVRGRVLCFERSAIQGDGENCESTQRQILAKISGHLHGWETSFSCTAVKKNELYGSWVLLESLKGSVPAKTEVKLGEASPIRPVLTPSPFHAASVTRPIS